jgi:hypothetical protein
MLLNEDRGAPKKLNSNVFSHFRWVFSGPPYKNAPQCKIKMEISQTFRPISTLNCYFYSSQQQLKIATEATKCCFLRWENQTYLTHTHNVYSAAQ